MICIINQLFGFYVFTFIQSYFRTHLKKTNLNWFAYKIKNSCLTALFCWLWISVLFSAIYFKFLSLCKWCALWFINHCVATLLGHQCSPSICFKNKASFRISFNKHPQRLFNFTLRRLLEKDRKIIHMRFQNFTMFPSKQE